MFDTALNKKRLAGLILLAVLLGLFLWFNRIPKLDTVQADLIAATAPGAQCFQGLCIDGNPESTLLSRWWEFSLTYLKLITLGMVFAFLVAGLTEVFLFPHEAHSRWTDRGLKGYLKGLLIGPAMNLCSACIVPISIAFRRRGAGVGTTLAIVQGSSTLNLPALIMAAMVFAPMLAGTRIGLSLVGVLLLGPLVAFIAGQRKDTLPELDDWTSPPDLARKSWGEVLPAALRDWLKASAGYLVRLGPIMVLAGFASGLAIQWISPQTVDTFLGNNLLGIVSAATLGLLINVPLLFEIPLVAALLLVGMGTAPAAVLLFAAAAGGPITFWGLAKVISKKTVVTFAAATWSLGAIAGLSILALGLLLGTDDGRLIRLADVPNSDCPACLLREAIETANHGDTIEIPPGTYTLTSGELVLNKDLTLAGAGAEVTIIEAATEPGTAGHRVLNIRFGRTVTVSGVTIRHGVVDSKEARHVFFPGTIGGIPTINQEFGGGIHIYGTLHLNDVFVTANQAGAGGGIFNGGTLTITSSAIVDNKSDGAGGGIFNGGILSAEDTTFVNNQSGSGGAIFNSGEISVQRSTMRANRTRFGGGGVLNSAIGIATLEYTTISGNSAHSGGGIRNEGALILASSTLSGNSAVSGGGIDNWRHLTLADSTVSGNQGEEGGGINHRVGGAPITEMSNTILAGNTAAEGPDCSGHVTSLGHNLLGNNDACGLVPAQGDLVGTMSEPVDPKLGSLGHNGGPTETHALLRDSPAIDAGYSETAPEMDQRGIVRPQGKANDIGSYERGS